MLDGPLGEKLQSANLAQVKLKYVTKMEQWDQVNFLCKYILNERLVKKIQFLGFTKVKAFTSNCINSRNK